MASDGESAVPIAETETDAVLGTVDSAEAISRTDSFKAVLTTDAEGAVHDFAQSSMDHKLRRVFDTFDLDGNGALSPDEVVSMVRTLHIGLDEEKVVQMVKAADLDDNGEVDFDEFTRAMVDNDFFDLVTIAYFPAEVYKILDEGSTRFLGTFKDYVVDIVDNCQKQVLAAQVPLASFGRIHTALADVKSALEGTAHEILSEEFTHLRAGAIESLKAQRDAIEARHAAHLESAIAPFRAEADERTAQADAQVASAARLREAADAESRRLHELFSEPEAIIVELQAQLEEATRRAAELEGQLDGSRGQLEDAREEWRAAYAQAIAASSIAPPPVPADAPPLVHALEARKMTLNGLAALLHPDPASGGVSKAEVRQTMASLELIGDARHGELAKQAKGEAGAEGADDGFVQKLDAAAAGSSVIAMDELRVLWTREWEPPPAPPPTTKLGAAAAKEESKAPNPKLRKHKASRVGGAPAEYTEGEQRLLPLESALGRALDRAYDEEARGARMLYLVRAYETALAQTRSALASAHAQEMQRVREQAATLGSSAAEAEAGRLSAWQAEREALASAHAAQLREVEGELEAQKAAREEQVSRLRQSAEAAQAKAVHAELAKSSELRVELKQRSDECEQLREELSGTTAALQETRQDREQKSFLVKQTKHELQTEHEEYEKKLRRINFALKKVEAAQPTQGGFFCAAARPPPSAQHRPRPSTSVLSSTAVTRPPPSEHRAPSEHRSPAAGGLLLEKTRSPSAGASTLHKLPGGDASTHASTVVDNKASRPAELSARSRAAAELSARSQPETERSELTPPEKRTKGKGKGKSKRAPK